MLCSALPTRSRAQTDPKPACRRAARRPRYELPGSGTCGRQGVSQRPDGSEATPTRSAEARSWARNMTHPKATQPNVTPTCRKRGVARQTALSLGVRSSRSPCVVDDQRRTQSYPRQRMSNRRHRRVMPAQEHSDQQVCAVAPDSLRGFEWNIQISAEKSRKRHMPMSPKSIRGCLVRRRKIDR